MLNKTIYFLREYYWLKGILLSIGKVNYRILVNRPGFQSQILYVKKDKCAFENDLVCIVWETWRGKNGRGGYRVERNLYPQLQVLAKDVCFQVDGPGRVTE